MSVLDREASGAARDRHGNEPPQLSCFCTLPDRLERHWTQCKPVKACTLCIDPIKVMPPEGGI